MEAASIVTLAEEASGSSATVMLPSREPKRPRTLETIRWRTTNWAVECDGSMDQVPGPGRRSVLTAVDVADMRTPRVVVVCDRNFIQPNTLRAQLFPVSSR